MTEKPNKIERFISFNKIGDFKSVVRNVTHAATFVRFDEENNEVIYDMSIPKPVLTVTGSEKIHGTNAAVCLGKDEFWVQSRKNIITPQKDNANCAEVVYTKTKKVWIDIITSLAEEHNIDLENNIISVFYEWAGGNIQSNSACSGLEKQSFIFQHFKVSPIDQESEEPSYWVETKVNNEWIDNTEEGIYNIMNFKTWEFKVDFNNPELSINRFADLVTDIEKNSYVGESLGKEGNIGEGVVFTFMFKDVLYKLKVKGDAHSKSKVKKLKPVDNAKEQLKIDVAMKVLPAWRLEQGYNEVFNILNGGEADKSRTGEFLKWVKNDIIAEEIDNIAESGLTINEVMGKINQIAKTWLFDEMNKF